MYENKVFCKKIGAIPNTVWYANRLCMINVKNTGG